MGSKEFYPIKNGSVDRTTGAFSGSGRESAPPPRPAGGVVDPETSTSERVPSPARFSGSRDYVISSLPGIGRGDVPLLSTDAVVAPRAHVAVMRTGDGDDDVTAGRSDRDISPEVPQRLYDQTPQVSKTRVAAMTIDDGGEEVRAHVSEGDALPERTRRQALEGQIPDGLLEYVGDNGFSADSFNDMDAARRIISSGQDDLVRVALQGVRTYEDYWAGPEGRFDNHNQLAEQSGDTPIEDADRPRLVDLLVTQQPGVDELNRVVESVHALDREGVTAAEVAEEFDVLYQEARGLVYPPREEVNIDSLLAEQPITPAEVEEHIIGSGHVGLLGSISPQAVVGDYANTLMERIVALRRTDMDEADLREFLEGTPIYTDTIADKLILPDDMSEDARGELMFMLRNVETALTLDNSAQAFRDAAAADDPKSPEVVRALAEAYCDAIGAALPVQEAATREAFGLPPKDAPRSSSADNGGGVEHTEDTRASAADQHPLAMDQDVANAIFRVAEDGDVEVPMRVIERWNTLTDDERHMLRDRLIGGKSFREIGEEFGGISKQAASQRINALVVRLRDSAEGVERSSRQGGTRGLSERGAAAMRADAYDASRQKDQTLDTVAATFGVSRGTVINWVRSEKERRGEEVPDRLGAPKDPVKEQRLANIRAIIARGEKPNAKRLAEEYGVSHWAIFKDYEEIRNEAIREYESGQE